MLGELLPIGGDAKARLKALRRNAGVPTPFPLESRDAWVNQLAQALHASQALPPDWRRQVTPRAI